MKRTNVGIVGCGAISKVHITALRKINECSLIAVCDLDEEKARWTSERYKIPRYYTAFDNMLEKESLEVVYVLTDPQSHPTLSIEAMKAGCHVLVEKPMSVTLREADEMVVASRRNHVKLCVSHSFIHTPPVLKARRLLRNGSLGELVEVDTVVSINPLMGQRHPQWIYNLPGGIFGEIIPHGLYTELAFLEAVDRVRCFSRGGSVMKGVPFKDIGVLLFSTRGLGRLLLTSSLKSSFTVVWLNVIGSEASLSVTIPTASVVEQKVKGRDGRTSRAMMNMSSAWQLIRGTLYSVLKALSGEMYSYVSYENLSRAFIRSVQGSTEPPVTPEEGREVVKVTEMIWKELGLSEDIQ
jgi:predicted dehydrogenase